MGTAIVTLLALSLASCGEARVHAAPAQPLPLASSAPMAGGGWALVHVGAASGEESFWELLWRRAGGRRWSLVTPPGVQDNGGLSIATAQGALVAGFITSGNLRFSPLAVSHDGGASWAPEAILPAGIRSGPDSLAASTGAVLALLARNGGEVLAPGTGGSSSSTLTSALELARDPVTRDCRLRALTALTVSTSGRLLVGGACAQRGRVGVYVQAGGRWLAAAPPVPAALRRDTLQALRLTSAGSSTFTLIAARSQTQESLLAAWSPDAGSHWDESPVLALGQEEVVSGVALAPGERALVTAQGPHGLSVRACEGPARRWRRVAPPPQGTATVVLGKAGEVEAFTVDGSAITSWRLVGASRQWHAAATLRVPLELGSSG
jgi:hypothetical protein